MEGNQITVDIGRVAQMAEFRLLLTPHAGRALAGSNEPQSDPPILKIASPCLYLFPAQPESIGQLSMEGTIVRKLEMGRE